MKIGKIIIMALLIFAVGCAKDKGNYKYGTLPSIVVDGLSDQTMVSTKILEMKPTIYVILGTDTVDVVIPPQEGDNVNLDKHKLNYNLSFAWEFDGRKISDKMYLQEPIEGAGFKYARYIITDNDTGIQHFFPFYINLASDFVSGYFALAADNDEKSILTFKSTRKGDEDVMPVTIDNIEGKKFGYKPVNIGNMPTRNGPDSYTNYELYISSEIGDDKVVTTDLLQFTYQGNINESSVIGGLLPEQSFIAQLNTGAFYLVGGRLHTHNKRMIYRASASQRDYYLAPWIGTGGAFANSTLLGYDEKNDEFLHFIKDVPNPEIGYVPDNYALDRVTPVPITVDGVVVPNYTKGHRLIAGYSYGGRDPLNQKVITTNNGKLHFYSFQMSWDNATFHFPKISKLEGVIEIPGTNENTCAVLNTVSYLWYIAVNNKIYTSEFESVSGYNEFFALPADAGDIVQMTMVKKDFKEMIKDPITGEEKEQTIAKDCMLIATYNPSSSKENKGSLYVVNLVDKNILESYPNCTGKVVSLFISLIK